jgi:TrkA domain protein
VADIIEQELPGIGRSFTIEGSEGDRVVVVIHHTGRRDVYLLAAEAEDPGVDSAPCVTFTDDQARQLGAVLSGAYFKPAIVEQVEAVIGELLIDWVTVRADSPSAGHTIAELEIRRRTRITVAAILRDGASIIAPEPSERIVGGDQLVVVGRPDDLPRFLEHVIG